MNHAFHDPYIFYLERTGDVEIFALLEVVQLLLKAQIESLHSLLDLPSSFDDTVKGIWARWVSSIKLDYNEEEADSGPVDDGGRLLKLEEISDNEDLEIDDPLDESISLPYEGRVTLAMTLPAIILASHYCRTPIIASDIYTFLIFGKIPFANLLSLIPSDLQKRLKFVHLALCKNPV